MKTKGFNTVGSIPQDPRERASVSGLIVNRIKKLKGDERKYLRQSFPTVDLDEVLILEQDRAPKPLVLSLAMIAGGVLLILGGGIGFVRIMKG